MNRLLHFIIILAAFGFFYSCRDRKQPPRMDSRTEVYDPAILSQSVTADSGQLSLSTGVYDITTEIDTVAGNYAYKIYLYEAPEDSVVLRYLYPGEPTDTVCFVDAGLADKVRDYINQRIEKEDLRYDLYNNLLKINTQKGLPLSVKDNKIDIYPNLWTSTYRASFVFSINGVKRYELQLDSENADRFTAIFFTEPIEVAYIHIPGRIALIRESLSDKNADTIIITGQTLRQCCVDYGFEPEEQLHLRGLSAASDIPLICNDTVTIETGLNVPDTDYVIAFTYRNWVYGDTLWLWFPPEPGEEDDYVITQILRPLQGGLKTINEHSRDVGTSDSLIRLSRLIRETYSDDQLVDSMISLCTEEFQNVTLPQLSIINVYYADCKNEDAAEGIYYRTAEALTNNEEFLNKIIFLSRSNGYTFESAFINRLLSGLMMLNEISDPTTDDLMSLLPDNFIKAFYNTDEGEIYLKSALQHFSNEMTN